MKVVTVLTTPLQIVASPAKVLKIPIAHADGNYYTDPVTLAGLQERPGAFPLLHRGWQSHARSLYPNGSLDNIAGIMNAQGNVLGMMPHPERSAEAVLGNDDGRLIFLSALATLKKEKSQIKMVGT